MLPCHVTLNTRPNMLHTQNSRCVACCDSNDNIAMLICYVWHSIQLIFILLLVCVRRRRCMILQYKLWDQVRVDQGEWVMLHGMLHVHEDLAVHLNCSDNQLL